jgi:hypothetical protein
VVSFCVVFDSLVVVCLLGGVVCPLVVLFLIVWWLCGSLGVLFSPWGCYLAPGGAVWPLVVLFLIVWWLFGSLGVLFGLWGCYF